MAANFPKHVPHKLHLVTLIGSGIRRPWWEKRCLKTLGLTKRNKKIVLKNTPQNNELLMKIKTLVKVQPITFVNDSMREVTAPPFLDKIYSDLSSSPEKIGELNLLTGPFINEKGEVDLGLYQEYVDSFPAKDFEEVLSKSHKEGSETLNCDHDLENEKKIKEKGKRIELYFQKKTWNYRSRLANRQKNLGKY